jgi:hypothetical protein
MYPKITSPCPFKFSKLPNGESNFCTHCSKTVHNLDEMCADERKSFVANRSGKVCVAYTVQRSVTTLGAGLALTVALSGTPNAYAGDKSVTAASEGAPKSEIETNPFLGMQEIMVGTVDSDNTRWAEARDIQPLPTLDADVPELEFVKAPVN